MASAIDTINSTQGILSDLGTLTAEDLTALWDALGSYDASDLARLAPFATPAVEAAAVTASGAQAAMLGELAGSMPPAVDTASIVANQLDALADPFTVTWRALSQGRPWADAVGAGRSQMEAYARDIAYQAARDTAAYLDAMPTLGESFNPSRYQQQPTRYERQNWDRPKWPRWGRVLTGMSCPWCQFFSTRSYYTAETATFGHARCDCVVAPQSPDTGDWNEAIRESSGYDEKKITAEMTTYNKRKRTGQSIRTADRRMAQLKVELAAEKDPARRDRLEDRIQRWETRGERARDRQRVR